MPARRQNSATTSAASKPPLPSGLKSRAPKEEFHERFASKVAVVTGASKGTGAAIAKGLSAAGALVIRSAALEPRGYAETREAARAAFAKSWRRK